MKKIVCYFLMSFLCLFAFFGVIKAEGENQDKKDIYDLPNIKCGSSVKSKGLAAASNVKVAYETLEVMEKGSDSKMNYIVDITIYNIPDEVYVEVHNSKSGKSYTIDSSKTNAERSIKLRQTDTSEIVNYTFDIKARTTECYGETLRTIKLSVPKYNYFSQRAVCADVPEFYMCNTFVSYDIDGAKFLSSVNAYKESLENDDKEQAREGKTSVTAAAAKAVSKHKFLILGIVLLAGVVATILVIKRKRSVL